MKINLSRAKGVEDKADDLRTTKAKLEAAIETIQSLQGLRIKHIDVHTKDKWSVVSSTAAEAEKAKEHLHWISTAIKGAKIM